MKNFLPRLVVLACVLTASNSVYAQVRQADGPFRGDLISLAFSGSDLFAGLSGNEVSPPLPWAAAVAPPLTPQPLTPGDGAVNVATRTLLSWSAPAGAVSYRLQIGLTAGFSSVLADFSFTWHAVTVVGFATGTTYYWRINAKNLDGVSAWSNPQSFTTMTTPDTSTSWTRANTGLTNNSINALAGSGPNLIAGTNGGGIFLSKDNGATWNESNAGLTNTLITALAVAGTNLFAGTQNGVCLSTNNGANWTTASSGLPNATVNALAVSGTTLFAATASGVYLSANNGAGWTAAGTGLQNNTVNALAVSGSNLFAGTPGGIFLSANNGTSWSNTGLANAGVYALVVSGNSLFAGTTGGVYLSGDNGANWTAVNNGVMNTVVRSLAVSGTQLFAGATGGVLFSADNGDSWGLSTIPNVVVKTLAAFGSNLFAGTSAGIWRRALSEMATPVERSPAEVPAQFSLAQNYPNPFNPSTTFTFTLASKSAVSLKVFDALGREAAVLVSEPLDAGTYSRQWNADGLPSGMYVCRLQAGAYTAARKLLLLR